MPVDKLEARLDRDCHEARQVFQPVFVKVRQEKGDDLLQAQERWKTVHANSIEAIRKAYILRLAEQAKG